MKPDLGEAGSAVPQRRWLFVVYALAGIALLGAGYVFRAELVGALYGLQELAHLLGPAAPFAVALVCGIWGALCLPGPLMQGFVGTLFASTPLVALAVVVGGETIAMSVAFALARHLGRRRVREKLRGKPWFTWLEDHTARKGVYGVFLVRLMPFFPNALGSYAFGLTSLRFLPYVLASFLGSLPKMVLYIFGTTSVVRLFQAGAADARTVALIALGLLAVVAAARALQLALRRRGRLKS